MGHPGIELRALKRNDEQSCKGIPGLARPMVIVASGARLRDVIDLVIYMDDKARPIDKLLQHFKSKDFMGCDFLDVEGFKLRITKQLNAYKFDELCRIVRFFLLNPTEDLDSAFARQHQTLKVEGLYYLPFVAWLAANNTTELFEYPYFIELMRLDKKSAKEAATIATAFGSMQFLQKRIKARLIEQEDIEKAINLAAANGDERILDMLLSSLKEPCPQNGQNNQARHAQVPLYWAIQNGHVRTVHFLLKSNPTVLTIQSENEENRYLHLAASLATTEPRLAIMRLLIAYGANLNQLNKHNRTPLHLALEAHKSKERNLNNAILMLVSARATDLDYKVGEETTRELLFKHMFQNNVSQVLDQNAEKTNHDDAITPCLRMER